MIPVLGDRAPKADATGAIFAETHDRLVVMFDAAILIV